MEERPDSSPTYVYLKAFLDHSKTYKHFLWLFKSQYQYAFSKLLPTEQLSLGGQASIRGYAENEIISDRGLMVTNELRSIPHSFWKNKIDELQFLLFLDFGWAANIDQLIYNQNSIVLASVGPGLRYKIKEYLSLRFDYGFQLKEVDRKTGGRKNYRGHFSIVCSF